MNGTPCEKCGHMIHFGEHPWCPHERSSGNAIDDTLTGGARWMHNLGDTPIFVETKSELKKIMAERGLVFAERKNYCKDDKSPYATRTRLRPGQRDPFIHGGGERR